MFDPAVSEYIHAHMQTVNNWEYHDSTTDISTLVGG
jgi:hypothetical protein